MSEVAVATTMERLGDHVDLLAGFAFKSASYTTHPEAIRLVRGDNIIQGRLRWDSAMRWPMDLLAGTERYRLELGDVVLAMDRPWIEAGLKYARIGEDDLPALLVQRVSRLRGKGGLDQAFLYCLLASREFTDHVLAVQTGTAVPHISSGQILDFQFRLPSLGEQRAVAGVLSALDDKIEQNRRTAQALERLARAIFQAWFVDFEPVKAKAAGAAAFPSMPQSVFDALPTRFVNSELGAMPEGWQCSTIGESANHVAMGPFGSDIKTDNFVAEGVPVIRGGNLTDGFVDEGFVYLTEAKANQLSNANAFPGDLVITHRGTLGQVGLIPSKSRHRRYVVSQSQMLVRPNSELLPGHFLYLFLTSPAGQHELLANRSQTGVPAISRPTTSVKAIRVVVPVNSVLLRYFESMASTLFDGLAVIDTETRKVAEMRDYLLPKLLSGDVRVRSAATEKGMSSD